MTDREQDSGNRPSEGENVYLSKILLFTRDANSLAEELRPLSENSVNTNCLNTIGMYPLIEHITTPLGTLSVSIWIISSLDRFAQFRMGYYSGASHSIIHCNNEEEFDDFVTLYNMTPAGVPTTILKRTRENDIEEIDQENFLLSNESLFENQGRVINYRCFSDIKSIRSIFRDIGIQISEDIASGAYHTFTPQITNPANIFKFYNRKSFDKVQKLVGSLGYELSEEGIVSISRDEFTFDIDFYRNQVTANVSNCLHCNKKCKHYRKLCVIEEDQGYSNHIHFDNLRALAILYSIHDGDFIKLLGKNSKEDIQFQLNRLKTMYKLNCEFEQEEEKYQKQIKKTIRRIIHK